MKSWDRRLFETFIDEAESDGIYSQQRRAIRVFNENQSQFGEDLVVSRTPIIELNSNYGISLLRDDTDTSGSATITSSNGEIVLSTGTTANSEASLYSAEIGRYIPASVVTPNLRIFAEINNNDDAEDLTAYVGGRQFSIIGTYVPKYRFTGDFRGSVNTTTTPVPLVSFRRKSDFNNRSVKLQSYDTIATSANCFIEIRVGGTLTGASFGTPTDAIAAETALESDKSATAISGGTVVWTGIVAAGTNINNSSLASQDVDLDIPNGNTVSLCARTITGTGSIVSGFNLREEW